MTAAEIATPRAFPAPPLRENGAGGMKCQMTHQNSTGAQETKKWRESWRKLDCIYYVNTPRESVAPYIFFVLLNP
jgi:hypothetical protein